MNSPDGKGGTTMVEKTREEVHRWISDHLWEAAGEKYGGLYVAVVNNEIVAHGQSRVAVEEEARRKHPTAYIAVLPVPRKEDLLHVLGGI